MYQRPVNPEQLSLHLRIRATGYHQLIPQVRICSNRGYRVQQSSRQKSSVGWAKNRLRYHLPMPGIWRHLQDPLGHRRYRRNRYLGQHCKTFKIADSIQVRRYALLFTSYLCDMVYMVRHGLDGCVVWFCHKKWCKVDLFEERKGSLI